MAKAAAKAPQPTIFVWQGKDRQGNKVGGELSAASMDAARALVRRKGVKTAKIKKKPKPLFNTGGKIKGPDITLFARQLAAMLQAGVPLVQSLDLTASGNDNKEMTKLIGDIRMDVESGTGFGQALRNHPKQFDTLFCSLVEAGEKSGTLDSMIGKVAAYKEKLDSLKAKVKKAMIYPISVLVVAFIVTALLLIKVVPQFETLFQSVGSDLPAFTKFVVYLSELAQAYILYFIVAVAGFIWFIKNSYAKSEKFAYKCDALMLKAPVMGDIIAKGSTAKVARTLATMITAGVPLVESLDSAGNASGNRVFMEAVTLMKTKASTGERLNEVMRESGVFSNMACQMTAIGEESGALDDMLGKVADYYEEQVDNAVDSLTTLMEPIILVFLGVVIGGLIIAMYLPIFAMGQAF